MANQQLPLGEFTGVLQKCNSRNAGTRTFYSGAFSGYDGWVNLPSAFTEGATLTGTIQEQARNPQYKEMVNITQSKEAAPAQASGGGGGNDRQCSILSQVAFKEACAMVPHFLNELGKGSKGFVPEEVIPSAVEDYTFRFYHLLLSLPTSSEEEAKAVCAEYLQIAPPSTDMPAQEGDLA